MHEFSIASSLLEQVKPHVPAGSRLLNLTMEAGPLQGIDPEAMQTAWQAVCHDTPFAGSIIELTQLPWPLHCPKCDRDFSSPAFPAACECGCQDAFPVGGRDLRVVELSVDP